MLSVENLFGAVGWLRRWPPPLRVAVLLFACPISSSAYETLPASPFSEARLQERERAGALVTGRVVDAELGTPVVVALVKIEGTDLRSLTDSAGRYRLRGVPPGPQILVLEAFGYAQSRTPITVPPTGIVRQDVELASRPLEVEGLIVTADPSGRGRGELGTASVIDRAAVANQVATSIRGVLELVPGVPVAPPGLDEVQQISLRAVPTNRLPLHVPQGPSATDLAAFGTLITLDGAPLSNNANLQTLGPRGEAEISTSAKGGIDLRRIPASTIERVEVIRGVPSARYGDLTQGVIVVDTRAAAVAPTVTARFDAHTLEASLVGGTELGATSAFTGHLDLAYTKLEPGFTNDDVYRVSAQLAQRATFGSHEAAPPGEGRLTLDTRVDFFQLHEDNPENPEVLPGRASIPGLRDSASIGDRTARWCPSGAQLRCLLSGRPIVRLVLPRGPPGGWWLLLRSYV